MNADLQRKQEVLDSLDAFIGSEIHQRFVAARQTELASIEDKIIKTAPVNQELIADLLLWHGERDCVIEMLKTFEDARATLKAEIDREADSDTESTETKV